MCQDISVDDLPSNLGIHVKHYHDGSDPTYERRDSIRKYALGIEKGVKRIEYATQATIYNKDTGMDLVHAISVCSPKDRPDRKRGWNIAVRRAVKAWQMEWECNNV